jgi:hypothetical protein
VTRELVNAGVSLATIRKRLGHRNLQTTLRYAEQSDAAADAEMRARRRRTNQRPRAIRQLTQGNCGRSAISVGFTADTPGTPFSDGPGADEDGVDDEGGLRGVQRTAAQEQTVKERAEDHLENGLHVQCLPLLRARQPAGQPDRSHAGPLPARLRDALAMRFK